MEYVNLGRTGLKVSRIAMGMMGIGSPAWREWVVDLDAGEPLFRAALDLGITFFDTADFYSDGASEEALGTLVKRHVRRDEVVLATKVYFPTDPSPTGRGLSRKHVLASIDASLARLGTDHVDLYQIHRWDHSTPIEETMAALDTIVRSGRARYVGASSTYAWQFAKAQHVADLAGGTRFVSMQNHYNLLYREEEREMVPQCLDMGVGLIPYSPLARGLLAGNRGADGRAPRTLRAETDAFPDRLYEGHEPEILRRVDELAERRGITPAQVALAWLAGRPGVVAPIVGVSRRQHLEQAVEAVTAIALDAEECAWLEEPYRPMTPRGPL